MHRRALPGLSILFLFALFVLPGCGSEEEEQPPDPFNIVLITIDTLRADHLSCYGYGRNTSPSIDRLAEEGILFQRVFCPIPLTIPSHASILSGLYPVSHGSRNNSNPINDSIKTMAQKLEKRGFTTAAVLSTGLLEASMCGLEQGFRIYCDLTRRTIPDDLNQLDSRIVRKDTGPPFPGRVPISGRTAGEAVEVAMKILEQFRGKKGFLWLHLYDPHTPYSPPGAFNTLFTADEAMHEMKSFNEWQETHSPEVKERIVDLYDGEIAYADRELGKFFAKIREMGWWDRTAIFLTADHGESLGEHGYYFAHGRDLYAGSVEIPLIIHVPWIRRDGGRVKRPVAVIDIFPTVMELAGIIPDPDMPGRSLLQDLRETKRMEGQAIYLENEGDRAPGKHGRGTLSLEASKKYALVWERWKIIKNPGGALELYDWYMDPAETTNLSATYPRLKTILLEKMDYFQNHLPRRQPGGKGTLSEESAELLQALGYIE